MDKTYKVMFEGRKLAEKKTLAEAQKWIADFTQDMLTDARLSISIVEQRRA